MIGVDTNILARISLLDEDHKIAFKLFENALLSSELFISSFTILEMVWVLKMKKFSRNKIYNAVNLLISNHKIKISDRDLLQNALDLYKNGKADFCDYLIIADGKRHGARKTATFDRDLLKDSKDAFHPSKYNNA